MSWYQPKLRQISRFSRLAREWLLWLAIMTLVTSCIVADPPQFTDPLQTPPELDVYRTLPPLNQVLVVKTGQMVPLTVPLRSEDAGEDLTAYFYLDYGTVGSTQLNVQTISASTYNGPPREVSTIWTVTLQKPNTPSAPTCHVLSLLVAHQNSFQKVPDATKLDPDKAKVDAAFVQWWVNANPADDMTTTLVNCPSPQLPGLMQ